MDEKDEKELDARLGKPVIDAKSSSSYGTKLVWFSVVVAIGVILVALLS